MLTSALSGLLRKQLVSNALSLYAVQGLNYLVPLIVLPCLLRALGPDAYGSIVLAQALVGYGIILTDFGFNFTAARDISVARRNPEEVARVYWTTMAAKAVLLAVSVVAIFTIVVSTPAFRANWPVYLGCTLLLVGNVAFPQWYFQGLERLKDVAIVQVIAKLAVAGATILLVRSPRDVWLAAVLSSAPQIFGVACAVWLGKPIAPAVFYRPKAAEVRAALEQSWHMFAASLSTTLYLNANAFALGLMCGNAAVAQYGLANRLVTVLQGIAAPATQAVFPRASLLFAERQQDAWILVARVAKVILPIVGCASLLLAWLAPQVVTLLGGASYAGAASVVRIMSLNPVLIAAAGIPAQIIMVNTGLTKQLLRIYVLAGIVNLVTLPPLIWAFAANGAALSLTIAETLACSLMALTVWRHRAQVGMSASPVKDPA